MTLYIILSIIIVYNYAILHIIQLALEAASGRANNIRGHIQHSSCVEQSFLFIIIMRISYCSVQR